MHDAFICDGIRTSIGRYGGALADVYADDLVAIPLRELLNRSPRLNPSVIDDMIFGYASQAGEDNRNVAHIAALLARYPHSVAGTTINRLCSSELDMIGPAARMIKAGDADLLIAGGVEPMSRVLFVIGKAAAPFQRQAEMFDTTIGWRLMNPLMQRQFGTDGMPETAENVAGLLDISREDQDAFAYRSQQRTTKTQRNGILAQKVVPIRIIGKKRAVSAVREDEHPRTEATLEQLAQLKVPFHKSGTAIADNAFGVSDGAAAVIVASEQHIRAQGLAPRTRIVVMAIAGVEPKCMRLGPVPAVREISERAGLNVNDMDVVGLDEALAAQALGVVRQFGLADDAERVNPNGGTIALGHPLGMSDMRLALIATLELERRNERYALYAMYIGVGRGIAMVLKRV